MAQTCELVPGQFQVPGAGVLGVPDGNGGRETGELDTRLILNTSAVGAFTPLDTHARASIFRSIRDLVSSSDKAF